MKNQYLIMKIQIEKNNWPANNNTGKQARKNNQTNKQISEENKETKKRRRHSQTEK